MVGRIEDDPVVKVEDLSVRFGDFTAVDGVSFEVYRGEIFGFLGPNGAGKTTTIRTITTIQKPSGGKVLIDGHDISDDFIEARKRIGIAQQHISLDVELTVRQNLIHHAMLHKIPKKDMERIIKEKSELLELGDYMDRKAEKLSGGWKRKASIVCAILHEPTVLFLDEPTAGLDTHSRHLLWDLIRNLNASGTTIFLTTHYIEEAESLCDRVAIIDHGRLLKTGSPEELEQEIGPVTVEDAETGNCVQFPDMDAANDYAASLGGRYHTIRRTTLEYVFLAHTGY
ncbi:MAG: ABC transporter ATP-binding protein [Candidatus Methanomethylophilaceae archaeon]|nr:ABC transporter ATP-binding protein [Candidatus Methanomethylophilaceae archaeon]